MKLNPKNTIKIQNFTKTRSSQNQIVSINLPYPQLGAQELFYNNHADVCIYGGAAGSGKAESCYALEWAFQNILGFTVDKYYDIIHLM